MKTYKVLNCYNRVCSKAYGIIKLHKDNHPPGPVVSTVGSHTYNMASHIVNVLNPLK